MWPSPLQDERYVRRGQSFWTGDAAFDREQHHWSIGAGRYAGLVR